jgi:hypothetical protein
MLRAMKLVPWAALLLASSCQKRTPAPPPPVVSSDEAIRTLVGKLELESYKATIKGLTKFGDRRQGTDRNRRAIAFIEAELKARGCTETARLKYEFQPAPRTPVDAGAGLSVGGGRPRGIAVRTGVNEDAGLQPDVALRTLNMEPSTPGPREEVYCTKVGKTHPEEMYIVGAHMDGHGWGEAANDDGSGTALVMELARVLSAPNVETERSIRFILWNNEETGLNGSRAYVDQRAALQGKEDPPGSHRYPEPKWLGMIQHDMMMFDHGMPGDGGVIAPEQRAEADVNIEFQTSSKQAAESERLAWIFQKANDSFATDYPAQVGSHMTNTDSTPFMDVCPAISLRELERGTQIGNGWDPHWHQPTDVYATFSDKDFRLGLNAAQTTLGAVARLASVSVH